MLSRKHLVLTLKFAVSALLIWYLFDNIDLGAAKRRMADMEPGMAVLAVGVVLIQMVITTLRWRTVLSAIGESLGFAHALRFCLIGSFFSQVLPSSVGGDAIRIYSARRAGLTMSGAINGVILERIAAVVALVVLVLGVQPLFQRQLDDELGRWFLAALTLAALAMVGGLALLMVLDRLPAALHRWIFVRAVSHLAQHTRRVFLVPRPSCVSVAWGVVAHVNLSLAVFVLALGLDIDVTMLDCLTLVPPVILATTLPISIAGWGIRESAMVVAFGLVGVSAESAVALSILMGLVAIVGSLPGGIAWLLSGESRKEIASKAGPGESP